MRIHAVNRRFWRPSFSNSEGATRQFVLWARADDRRFPLDKCVKSLGKQGQKYVRFTKRTSFYSHTAVCLGCLLWNGFNRGSTLG